MTREEARELLDFMGTREDAVANNCAHDWDEAWGVAFADDTPIHMDIATCTELGKHLWMPDGNGSEFCPCGTILGDS